VKLQGIAVASLLQQLQGDDTLLLMYLVDELPAADRAEVERRLAADAKLRADLDRLTETYGSFISDMQALDGGSPMHADVSAAVRRASSAIRQWQARPAPAVTYGVERHSPSRWRVWTIPSAAAAIVLVVVGVSLYSGPTPRMPVVVVPPQAGPQTAQSDDAAMAKLITQSPGTDALAEAEGPGFNSDLARDESTSKALREDAVFNVPEP